MDETRTGPASETPDTFTEAPIEAPLESESGLPARQERPRQADIEVTLGRLLIFLAFPLVALAGALRLFDADLGVFPPRLLTSNPPEASAEPAPTPAKADPALPEDKKAEAPDRPAGQ
jgi:hypothetical protein